MAKNYTTGKTEPAFENGAIKVGTCAVQFSDKDTPNTYQRISWGDSANTLLLAKDTDGTWMAAIAVEAKPGLAPDSIDTAKQKPRQHKLPNGCKVIVPYGHTIGLFGGYVDPTDASALKGALREVMEEAGLTADEAKVIHAGKAILKPAWSAAADSMYIAVFDKPHDFGAESGHDDSTSGRYWLPFDDVYNLVVKYEAGSGGAAEATPFGAHEPALIALMAAKIMLLEGTL